MTLESLRSADWGRMERDVVARIRLLRDTCRNLAPGDQADLVARDLLGPNVQLLATFCENVAVPGEVKAGSN